VEPYFRKKEEGIWWDSKRRCIEIEMIFGCLHERMQKTRHVRLACGPCMQFLHPPSLAWVDTANLTASCYVACKRILPRRMQASGERNLTHYLHGLYGSVDASTTMFRPPNTH
jgi:hypothetical protein